MTPLPRLSHSRNLRLGRYSESGRIYLLTATTYRRTRLFNDFWLGRIVVKTLRYQDEQGFARSLAFVIMPDHLHWLVQLSGRSGTDGLMRTVKAYSAWRINELNGSFGRKIWQPGYHDRALRSEEDVRAVARYVVANPLRARLVQRLSEYPLWDATWL